MSVYEQVLGCDAPAVGNSGRSKSAADITDTDDGVSEPVPFQDEGLLLMGTNREDHNDNDDVDDTPPHQRRIEAQLRITWFDASMHLIKGNLGPGCLNLPHAFALSGWLLGSALFLVVALQGIYSMMLLAECKQLLRSTDREVFTFMDVARASLGSKGHSFVQIFLFIMQTGVCCVFLSLIATNLRAQTETLSQNVCIALVTFALLLIVLVRYMKDLMWFSTTANAFMLTAILTAAVAAVFQVAQYGIPMPDKASSDLGDVATFISSMFFSFEGIGLVLPVENSFTISDIPEEVNEANHFYRTGVLPGAMSVVGVLFWIIGFFASWGFPEIENGSITAYLAEQFPEQPWYQGVNTLVMLAVFLTFPLQLTPALEVLEEWWDNYCTATTSTPDLGTSLQNENITTHVNSVPERLTASVEQLEHSGAGLRNVALLSEDQNGSHLLCTKTLWKKYVWIIPRYSIVFGCALVVLLVDDLGLLMALFGAVGQTGLAMMPCLCHLALQRSGIAPPNRLKTFMDVITVLFAVLVMLFGLVVSIDRILQRQN